MSYNEAKESTSLLEKCLYFLVRDNKDLDTFYKGDELYGSDELYRLARLDAIKEVKRENSRNIAKKMLSHNLSIDIISEITGLEIDEINNIKSQD